MKNWKPKGLILTVVIALLISLPQLSHAGRRTVLGEENSGLIRDGSAIIPGPGMSLGDYTNRFKDIWVEGSSIHLGNLELKENDNDQGLDVGSRLHLKTEGGIGGSVCLHPGASPDANPTGARLWIDNSGNLQMLEANADPNIKVNTAIIGVNIYNRVTGWLEGGQISINGGDNTKIDITAGSVLVVDSNTSIPTLKIISWNAQTALDPALTTRTKWVGVKDDGAGNAGFVYDVGFDSTERRTTAIIGKIRDNAGTGPQITNIDDFERPAWGLLTALQDFILEYGSWNISGNVYSANGANLLLDKSPGKSYRYHAEDTIGEENVHTDASQSPRTSYAYHLQNTSTTIAETDIDPDNYDLNGIKTALANNKWTVQEVWYWPVSGGCHVLYGQTIYSSKAAAIDGITTETKTRNTSILDGAILRAYLVLEKGCTDLTDSTTAEIREAGMAAGGGGGSALWTRTGTTLSPTNSGDNLVVTEDISISNLVVNKSFRIADSSGNLDAVITRQATTNDVYIGDVNSNGGKLHFYADGSEFITISEDGVVNVNGAARITGGTTPIWPSTGEGLELVYDSDAGVSGLGKTYFQSYDRTGAAFQDMSLRGSTLSLLGDNNTGITIDPSGNVDIRGSKDTLGQISLQLKSGNTGNNFNSNQIVFGYEDSASYRHAIKTRHNSAANSGNAIDFYLWDFGIDAIDDIGTKHVMSLNGGNIGIGTTNPNSKLEISSLDTSGTIIGIDNTDTGGRKWQFYSTGSGNSEGAGSLLIRDADAGNVRMMIATNGDIGVGITPSLGRIHVKQGGDNSDKGITTEGTGGGTLRMYHNNSNQGVIQKGNNANQIALNSDGSVDFTDGIEVKSTAGITIGDGNDVDQDLITVSVVGTPKFWWDEATDSFEMNKTLTLPQASLRIGTSVLSEVGGILSTPSGMAAQDLDIDGEAKIYADGFGGVHFEAPASPGSRIDIQSLANDVNVLAGNDINLASTGTGNIIISDYLGIGAPSPESPLHIISSTDFGGDDLIIEKDANVATGLKIKRNESGGSFNESWYMYMDGSSTDLRFYGKGDDRFIITNDGNLYAYNDAGNSSTIHQTISTGTNSTDGTAFGVSTAGDAIICNRENTDMYFYTNDLERMRITAAGIVSIGGIPTGTAKFQNNDFTKLGSDAPAIKMKKLTGTTSATEGDFTSITHGLTQSKIIGIQVFVSSSAGALILPGTSETAGYQYSVWTYSANIIIKNHDTNSENILNAPITMLITYEQ